MSSMRWTTAVLGFLCLCSTIRARDVRVIREKNSFKDKYIIFDNQPIKDNTLLFAACDMHAHHHEMNCSVILESFPTAERVDRMICNLSYQTDKDRSIMDEFQLKLLYDDQVIFMLTDKKREESDTGRKVPVRKLVYRTIDMSSCKTAQHEIPFKVTTHLQKDTDDFHVVPYVDNFDLFYRNKSLCGEYMCGKTQDKRGRIINGPVASFLPTEYFKESTFVYPVKPKSPALGHFLLSSKFHLVSSYYGELKHLMDYPGGPEGFTFSCNNGFLGFCGLSHYNDRELNCTQFNSKGEQVRSEMIHLKHRIYENYRIGGWMAMSNLRNGGMLLLTSKCDERSWCESNMDKVEFLVHRVNRDVEGRETVELLDETDDIDCNYVRDIKMEIHERDNGDVCFSLACHVTRNDAGEAYVNLLAKCISRA